MRNDLHDKFIDRQKNEEKRRLKEDKKWNIK
jgi:hypothetical protein